MIRGMMKVEGDVLEVVEGKTFSWYGHVRRMRDGRLPKVVMRWVADGSGGRGRPSGTWWLDGVRENRNLRGLHNKGIIDK